MKQKKLFFTVDIGAIKRNEDLIAGGETRVNALEPPIIVTHDPGHIPQFVVKVTRFHLGPFAIVYNPFDKVNGSSCWVELGSE